MNGASRFVVASIVATCALAANGLLAACGNATGAFEGDPSRPSLEDGGGTFGAADGQTAGPAVQCAEATKDVFVISEERTLYAFHPPTLTFQAKGILQCPAGGATPTSMAIDRTGIAWVRYSDGSLWKVSTFDLTCEATAYAPQPESFVQFGMGFATETNGGSAESLYLSDSDGAGLAKLDTSTLSLRYLGPYTGDLAGSPAELTGTGDGKLYGFFVTSPAQIAEISKSTGSIITTKELPGVNAGTAWAFSFYAGDFYVYTNAGSGDLPLAQGGSDVTRFRPSDGSITVVKSKIGFKIVGAGVSTCAPFAPPR